MWSSWPNYWNTASALSKFTLDQSLCVLFVTFLSILYILARPISTIRYLRDSFFGLDEDLNWAGVLNPLDTPNHPRATEKCLFREGVAADHPKSTIPIWANIGLDKVTEVNHKLEGEDRTKRLTFMNCGGKLFTNSDVPKVFRCPRHLPTTLTGIYWGYQVRTASSFNAVFTQSPHDDGYDQLIGVCNSGGSGGGGGGQSLDETSFPAFKHAIIVFGGVRSIDQVLEADDKLQVKDPLDLFDSYVNAFASLDTSRIRTEESLLINLSLLRPKLIAAVSGQPLPVATLQEKSETTSPSPCKKKSKKSD